MLTTERTWGTFREGRGWGTWFAEEVAFEMCLEGNRGTRDTPFSGSRVFLAEGTAVDKENHRDGKLKGICGQQPVVWFGVTKEWGYTGNRGLEIIIY